MKNKIIIFLVLIVPIALFAMLEHNSKNNEANAALNKIDGAKLIKFYSPMCSECKTVSQNVQKAMQECDSDIIYEEVDVSNSNAETKALIDSYKVSVVPTVIFVDKNGKIVNKTEGMISMQEVKNYLEEITND